MDEDKIKIKLIPYYSALLSPLTCGGRIGGTKNSNGRFGPKYREVDHFFSTGPQSFVIPLGPRNSAAATVPNTNKYVGCRGI